MSIPRLSRRQSSLAALIEQETSFSGENRATEENETEVQAIQPNTTAVSSSALHQVEEGDTDIEGGDTDIEGGETDDEDVPPVPSELSLSKQKTIIIKENEVENVASRPPLRMSSRLVSMKRRGKVVLLRELTQEFEFHAGDILTVRGEEDDFYVCRVLEDIPVLAMNFLVAWYNRVGPNIYEVSFDDVCDMKSVITRVLLNEKDGKFSLPRKCIKQTKRLLREALAEERGEQLEDEEDVMEEEEDDEDDEEAQPPAKRTRSSDHIFTPSPRKGKKGKSTAARKATTPTKGKAQKRKAATPKKTTPKKEPKKKKEGRRPGVLIPNLGIELIDIDPSFESREDIGLMPCKQSIRAVLLNDMDLLKECINDVKEVHTVHWPRSPDVGKYALHYAIVNNNIEAVELLLDDLIEPKEKRCHRPNVSLEAMDTGSYNFHTFGHAVREIYASRGSREGNNAFLKDKDKSLSTRSLTSGLLDFCFKTDVSMEMVEFLLKKLVSKKKKVATNAIENVWMAVRCGNRKLAGHFVKMAVEKDGFGFNFLHKEVLINEKEPLSKFRSPSVKKKPYMNKCILPLHAACINPNGQYLKDLLSVVPEYNIPDKDGYKMLHYACACQGPGPLKVLLSRGVDPNDLAPKGVTPLMIAAKYGRDENVEALLATENPTEDDDIDEEGLSTPRVAIDAKSRTTKAAIHHAASGGHVNTIRILVSHGSNINLQTGSGKGNVTPLMQGAKNGNLDVVKTCVELGGKADMRGKWKMTALMYAVKNGHSIVVAYLLHLGVDPNAVDTSCNTPVHYAAAYGWLHCLQLLIKAGANPNAINQWKTTALALGMMKDHIKCTDYLLSLENCNVNFPDDNGQTLLSQTVRKLKVTNKLKSRVSYLVDEKGADVKAPDAQGWTPLHHLAAKSIYMSPGTVSTIASYTARELRAQIPESKWLGIKETETTTTAPLQTQEPEENEDMDTQENHDSQKDDDDVSDVDDDDDECDDDDDDDESDDDDDDDESDDGFKRPSYTGLYTFEKHVSPPPRLLKKSAEASCDIAEILVQAGGDVNAIDGAGLTPLMLAILQQNYPLIRKLIDLGAKPSLGKNEKGRQVVHLQAQNTNTSDLREMYSEENEPPLTGTVQEQSEQREEFLEKLVKRTNTDILKLFITAGAEISTTDDNGLTPLMVALYADNLEMFEILLDNNADPSMGLEDTGRNVLHLLNTVDLYSRGRLASEMVYLMDDSACKTLANTVDNNGFTPLLLACENYAASGHSKSEEQEKAWSKYIEVLIEDFGCDVTARVGKFKTGEKVKRANVETLGMTVCLKDDDEYVITGLFSCLHFFGDGKTSRIPALSLKQLLKHLHGNRDVINSRDRNGCTPLHLAVIRNNVEGVQELVKSGAAVNVYTKGQKHSSTPLILACTPTLELHIATCLLQWKANPNLKDMDGRSALSHAVTNEPDSDESSLKLVHALLEAGADVNSADHKDRSVLHYAVNTTTGGFETLSDVEEVLLKHGADTTMKDIRGRIPLHYAFVKIKNHSDASLSDPVCISSVIVEAMMEQFQGTTTLINHADNFGQTPLHRAAIRGATLCILHLVKKGATVNVKDNNGNTPFSLAIREGHDSCAMTLIQSAAGPRCDVISPVTQEQLTDYEKEKKRAMWIWKELNNLKVPKPIIKSAFQCVVERNWQGIAYLMLVDIAGLDFIVALRAVLCAKNIELAWTLLRKQKKDACVQGVDDKGRNILHLLALHIVVHSGVVDKIAVHVLQRGVSPSCLDKEGAIPLHYAACNGNKGLCELLLRYNPSTINVAHPSGMTPFAGCFDSSDLDSRHQLIESLVEAKPRSLDVCYKVETLEEGEASKETTTPLIEACLSKDEFLLKLLLENQASVNFTKGNRRTPLMEVVRANLEDIAKVLLYGTTDRAKWKGNKTKLDMFAVDNEGKSVVHHCVQNREYGSSENVSMLLLLAKFAAPLEVLDNSGKSPLDYAMKHQSGKMKEALVDLIGDKNDAENGAETMEMDEQLGFHFTSALNAYWEGPEPDVDGDSEAMLAEAKSGDEEPDWDPSKPPPVDSDASVENGEVCVDPDTGIPYDILMSKVNVNYGLFGLNIFYKMQVVHHKGKDLWVLLNRWGRIGDSGKHQRTPFGSPTEATDEFRKIFRSKTGNKWDDKDKFQKMRKKYALVLPERNPEFKRKKATEILKPFDLHGNKCPPSRLPKELQKLMEDITDVQFMRNAMDNLRGINIDYEYMPFGRLSTETINKALDLLLQIKEIVSGIDRENMKGSEDKFEQVVDLSNSYYMLIPMANYAFEKIRPLNEVGEINRHLESLTQLTELAFVSKMLLAAQYRAKEMNPLDYCYRVLGAHIELMDCDSDECQLVLKYIHNSSRSAASQFDVVGVYRVSRPVEKQRMTSCGVHDNHRLLWHGTKTAHVLGILKQGLRIAPPEAITTGWMLGKGIYFSDGLDKSLSYSDLDQWRGNGTGFAVLCQVALGTQYEMMTDTDFGTDPITSPPSDHDSIWLRSQETPDPSHDVTTPYGTVVPAGPLITDYPLVEKYKQKKRPFWDDSEFVVYDEAQVQQRYLVQVLKK